MTIRKSAAIAVATVSAIGVGAGIAGYQAGTPLVVGRMLTPTGTQAEVGSFPVNMTLSPDGRFLLVTNCGFREQISVIATDTGSVVDRADFSTSGRKLATGLYYGIATTKAPDGGTLVAASRGAEDKISLFRLSSDGKLTIHGELAVNRPAADSPLPAHIAGIAFSPDGRQLLAVQNQTHAFNGNHGAVSSFALYADVPPSTVPVGRFPLAVAKTADAAFVANEGEDNVTVYRGGKRSEIRTGTAPAALLLSADHSRLFVANSMSDTISVISTADGKVLKTILVRPAAMRGIPGTTPLGMALAPDAKTLYVAVADLNAVAVLDVAQGRLIGMIPAGWYPTSVALSPDGRRLFVANAKGVQVRNPNGVPVRTWDQYAPNIIEGTVSMIDIAAASRELAISTRQVLANNHIDRVPKPIANPGIRHVVYIIKENRTYDQVMGDLPKGNADPSLVLFGRDVTPNQHALAERFALLDNFYVCAEVSADGWNWSTSGQANAYTQRNVPYNYSGRGRNYDFEGTVNGRAVELDGDRDVATAAGGYLWDAAKQAGVSFRNYGMFTAFASRLKMPNGDPLATDNAPTKRALLDVTNSDFRMYDLSFADSEAWVKHGVMPAPRQLTAYGSRKDPSRMTTWVREFRAAEAKGDFPQLSLLRLGRNHTLGTAAGTSSPRACVADNDYAVGQVVEAISHSKFWKDTAIFVLEDDAQAGFDHVDCHRSPVLVISPFVARGTLSSDFANTDSVLRTIGDLLRLKPWNQYIATTPGLTLLGRKAANVEAYQAILPARDIIGEVNGRTAYRSADSARLISRFEEESGADIELNDILWGAIKGARTPRPTHTNGQWSVR